VRESAKLKKSVKQIRKKKKSKFKAKAKATMRRLFRRDNSSSDTSPQSSSNSLSTTEPPVTGPARPIRLVYCDERGKFQMDPEAVAALQLVKGPIGVVSVCGRARQGKSYILNQVRFLFLLVFCFISYVKEVLWNLGFVNLGVAID
jgi:hypothetical protein